MLHYEDGLNSSAIEALAYDSDERALFVFFHGRSVTPRGWRYEGVTPDIYQAFLNADSRGRYFGEHVKEVYAGTLLSDAEVAELRTRAEDARRLPRVAWAQQLWGASAETDTQGLFF